MWITTPDTTHLRTPHPLRFISASSFLLVSSLIAHPAFAVRAPTAPPPLFLFPSSIADVICHTPGPFVRPVLSAFPFFFWRLVFSASLLIGASDELAGGPPPHSPHPTHLLPLCGPRVVRHGWGLYIFF